MQRHVDNGIRGSGVEPSKGPKVSKLDFDKMAMKFLRKRIFNGSTSVYDLKSQQRQTVPST